MSRTLIVDDAEFDALVKRVVVLEHAFGSGPSIGRGAIPVPYHLFAPTQPNGSHTEIFGAEWSFPGAALSSSVATFHFQVGLARIAKAVWHLIWRSGSKGNMARLAYMDDGPSNIVEIVRFVGIDNAAARPMSFDVTAHLQTLVDARQYKHIGNQFRGDGVNSVTVYESTLDVYYAG